MAAAVADELRFRLDVFEGPLDLLLYLLKREEIDVIDIPIERITRQYMDYLNVMKMLDLNIAGEFIVMAATLMMIKSRMLLPEDERPEIEEEDDDPRWELVRQLIEYKKFKEAAVRLEEMGGRRADMFGRGSGEILPAGDDGLPLEDVSVFELIAAFNEAIKRARSDDFSGIEPERFTIADKIDTILKAVRRDRDIGFKRLFAEDAGRQEIVCTFLALLELIRLRQVRVSQKREFDDIVVSACEC